MSEKFIVTVSVTLTIEASSHTVAMVKAAKKFSGYIVNQIDVFNEDGSEAGTISPGKQTKP